MMKMHKFVDGIWKFSGHTTMIVVFVLELVSSIIKSIPSTFSFQFPSNGEFQLQPKRILHSNIQTIENPIVDYT